VGRREIEHNDFNQRTLGLESRIYHEALTGSSWYEAGVLAGLKGHHHQVIGTAVRMAKAYAKLYRNEWPLPDTDARDGHAALHRALLGESWDEVATALQYQSPAQAEEHAQAAAQRTGVDLSNLTRLRLGRAAYVRRQTTADWKAIAAALGSMENTVKVAAEVYAKETKSPWPLRYKPPAWGEIAYKRRAESNETWKTIAADLGLDWEYLCKEAREYALKTDSPWPLPIPPRLYRDTGKEAYELRRDKKLSWVAIANHLGISRAWAIRSAQRYVRENPKLPWPIRMPEAESVEQEAYELRIEGHGWEDVAEMMGCSLGVAQDRARRFAGRSKKAWPIKMAPVRTSFSARAKAAYERGYVGKESWHDLANELGYSGSQSCQNSARVFAERFGLPLHIRRRGKLTRDHDRPRVAYEMRRDNPEASWTEIGQKLGYKAWRSAYTAANKWAEKNGLTWPLGETKEVVGG